MEKELIIMSKEVIPKYTGFAKIDEAEFPLNNTEIRILFYCYMERRFISQIARHLGINVKNVSVKIPRLKKLGLIEIKKFDKVKKYVTTICKLNSDYKENEM